MHYEYILILQFWGLAVIWIKIMFYLMLMGRMTLEQGPGSGQEKGNGHGRRFFMLHISSNGALIAQMSEEKHYSTYIKW